MEQAIRNKYAGRTDKSTQQKMQNEIMDLYQRENFNPMGGCLPMLIQLPILFSLYNVVVSPLKYICGFGEDVVKAIQAKVYELMSAADCRKTKRACYCSSLAMAAVFRRLDCCCWCI